MGLYVLLFFSFNSYKFLDQPLLGCYRRLDVHMYNTMSYVRGVGECVQACRPRRYQFAGLQVSKFIRQYFMEIFDHV